MKQLHKFTDAYSGNPVYIDLGAAVAVQESSVFTSTAATLSGSTPPQTTEAATSITIYNFVFNVKESLAEVLAIVEGRDPYPAKILFGSKNGRDST